MSDLDTEEFNQFILARKGRKAKSTLQNYKSALRIFEDYCLEYDVDPREISGREMDTFFGYLQSNVSEITAAQYLGNISQFYEWFYMDSESENPVSKLPQEFDSKSTEHKKPTLDIEQIKDLVDSAETVRAKALLSLMASTGLRLAEACQSELSCLDLEERELEVETVKTDFGDRFVYFDRKTRRLLDKYINDGYRAKYHLPDSDYIFIASNTNQYGTDAHISTDVGRRLFMKALENSSIDIEYEEYSDGRKRSIYTTHILRRTFCQNWIDKNGDIMSLRNIVGWMNLETAKHYVDDTASIDKRDRYGVTL
ncbi:tyrosine-type recombinase/integrase [Halorubrum laminariae]|uniref:Tyrosine-type recombinase/integrase n=1 Tax=Halorubrum laminariae TaxID=1433523 RepID=A0ABD6BY36_9EURY|nr:tyrosine-type recombinase/integrase [Halorubrum laminariae]